MDAIILAGGRGTRLQPWHAPKCLMPVNGVPMLHRLLGHLGHQKIGHFIICVGHRASDVEASLSYVSHFGYDISDAGAYAPMGARLLKASKLTRGNRVLICYGDELADVDVQKLVAAHETQKVPLTFVCVKQKVPGGTVEIDEWGRPRIVENQERLVNIGFVVVEPECWDLLTENDGLSDWINRVGETKRIGVYEHTGRRATVNALADLQHAEEVWK